MDKYVISEFRKFLQNSSKKFPCPNWFHHRWRVRRKNLELSLNFFLSLKEMENFKAERSAREINMFLVWFFAFGEVKMRRKLNETLTLNGFILTLIIKKLPTVSNKCGMSLSINMNTVIFWGSFLRWYPGEIQWMVFYMSCDSENYFLIFLNKCMIYNFQYFR